MILEIFFVVFAFAHNIAITRTAIRGGIIMISTQKMAEVVDCHFYTTKLTKVLNNYRVQSVKSKKKSI